MKFNNRSKNGYIYYNKTASDFYRIEKQELSVELLKYAKSNNETNLVKHGGHIVQAIECINEPLSFHTAKILNSVDLSFKTVEKKKDLNPDEFLRALENYGQKGDIVNVNYRC